METLSTRQAFGEALRSYGAVEKRVCVVDADFGSFMKTNRFAQDFPKRHVNVGVAEQNMIGVAAGLARMGKIPFAATYATLLCRAFEQIRTSVAYANLPVKLVGAHTGVFSGESGPTHHALEDITLMRSLPNMKVFSPADEIETKQMTQAVIADPSPCYIRLADHGLSNVFDRQYEFKIGKGTILVDGDDVGIISTGTMTSTCFQVAQKLRDRGISTRIVNMGTLKPIDVDLVIDTARKCKVLVTAEDHRVSGLGGIVAEILTDQYPKKLHRIGIGDVWTESGHWRDLYQKYGLNVDGIYNQVLACVKS
jgi:transketolase